MARKMKIELNSSELRRLLQTDGLVVTRKVGEKILDIVGTEHYEIEEWVGRNRGRVTIRTKPDGVSMGHEAKYHNLIRALGSVRV